MNEVRDEISKEIAEKLLKIQSLLNEAIAAYPGGVEEISKKLNTTPRRLEKALKNLESDHKGGPKLGVLEFQEILKLTGNSEILQILAGPEREVVRLLQPSVETEDPRIILSEVHKNFGLLLIILSKNEKYSTKFPNLLKVYGSFLEIALKLANKSAVSKNELKELSREHFSVHEELTNLAANIIARQIVLQAISDIKRAADLIQERLPIRPTDLRL